MTIYLGTVGLARTGNAGELTVYLQHKHLWLGKVIHLHHIVMLKDVVVAVALFTITFCEGVPSFFPKCS